MKQHSITEADIGKMRVFEIILHAGCINAFFFNTAAFMNRACAFLNTWYYGSNTTVQSQSKTQMDSCRHRESVHL